MSDDENEERPGKLTGAYAEWDDRESLFRVFIVRDNDENESKPMDAVHDFGGRETEAGRLYKAAFVACPKDFRNLKVGEPLGWDKSPTAARVAKAVAKEIERMTKGLPGPTNETVRHVLAFTPRGRK